MSAEQKEDQTMARLMWVLTGILAGAAAMQVAAKDNGTSMSTSPPRPEAVAALRARGPEGLAQALSIYDGLHQKQAQLMFACSSTPGVELKQVGRDLEAWSAAIDQIGAQRDCTVSRLYWYTDLAGAKEAAERTGRPILSLRMLGKLTDEYSCANSRFFRTALYSNKEISDYLRKNFTLHWQSVRPVPRVTIDFGDGRKLARTLTGNSAHYVLASDGTPLDVLPGLYSPQEFLKWLRTVHDLDESYNRATQAESAPGPARAEILKRFHQGCRDAILQAWDRDLQRLGERQVNLVSSRINIAMEAAQLVGEPVPDNRAPKARTAAQRAVAKSAAEVPLLRFANYGGQWMEKGMDDDLWNAIARLHRPEVRLDGSSIEVMKREAPAARVAARLTASKAQVENPVLRMVRTFEESIALDTVRNEYLLHRRVHEMLARTASGSMDFDALNEWVYADLFLTPSSDPWLGLAPPDVYTALENGGCVVPKARAANRDGG
ncbi:MAG TPA: hypothetical protein VHE81_16410 [Lacipirellulaceae bacterium]|nr:hypothetical protein [Lacipirellulaceae bacterium]